MGHRTSFLDHFIQPLVNHFYYSPHQLAVAREGAQKRIISRLGRSSELQGLFFVIINKPRRLKHFLAFRYKLLFRSEEHTSELQSLMRISYAVFCLKKKRKETLLHTFTILID